MWVVHLLVMSVRNVSFMLKECIEAKWNRGELQTGWFWCSAPWVPYWSILELVHAQSWCMLTTLLWDFWQLQVIFPFENQDFGTQSWIPRLKNFKSQVFFFIRDVHRQWVSEMTSGLCIKEWLSSVRLLLWSTFILDASLVRMFSACWETQRCCSSLEHKAALGWFVCRVCFRIIILQTAVLHKKAPIQVHRAKIIRCAPRAEINIALLLSESRWTC